MGNHMISIITVNYNNAAGLEKTIKSVIQQTYNEVEYIIIDGGSDDHSVDVIQGFQKNINYWVSEKDNGIYHAMNKGISKAKGEYLLFLNSGDYLISNDILLRVVSANALAKDIVYGDLYFTENGLIVQKKEYPDKVTFKYFFDNESLPHPSTFIRRSLFDRVGVYNEELKIVSDWEFWLKAIFLFQASYVRLPFPVSIYNLEGISSKPENRVLDKEEKELVYKRYFSGFIDDYKGYEALYRDIGFNIFIRILKKLKLLKYGL